MEEVHPVYLQIEWQETTVYGRIGMPDGTLTDWLDSKELVLRITEVLYVTGGISEEAFTFLKEEVSFSPLPHDPTIKPLGFVFISARAFDTIQEEALSEYGEEDEHKTRWIC